MLVTTIVQKKVVRRIFVYSFIVVFDTEGLAPDLHLVVELVVAQSKHLKPFQQEIVQTVRHHHTQQREMGNEG